MSDPLQLFPETDAVAPPERCPRCGRAMHRTSFTAAECVSCDYTWRRSAQIASNEPWPGEPL